LSSELLTILAEEPGGLAKPALFARMQELVPGIRPNQVARDLQGEVDAAHAMIDEHGVVHLVVTAEVAPSDTTEPSTQGPRTLRVVAFDVESIIRATEVGPDYKEARIFQIAGVRFGRDKAWCHEQRIFDAYLDLPGSGWDIRSDEARERWERLRRPMVEVLEDFREFVRDADVLVAYNGTGVDFPLLTEALHREGLPGLDRIRYVDGYYLALALWPTPPRQHRLFDLATRVGAKITRLQWHNAVDDSMVLAQLLGVGAKEIRRWPVDVRGLVRSATVESPGWNLLFDLAHVDAQPREWADVDVAATVSLLLDNKPPRRPAPDESTAEDEDEHPLHRLSVPASLLVGGQVSPLELARAAGKHGEPRPSQHTMVSTVQSWIDEGHGGLVEAPTGTGKSYAMLANALDWLAGDPKRKAIIATFTKQLQKQMADDIQALTGVVPGLESVSDMVKGRANRLSLRGLVTALTDTTRAEDDRRTRRRTVFARDVEFRELLVFLALRLGAPATMAEEWEGRSVDRSDVPAFFDQYCGPRLYLYLRSLSQEESGDYGPSAILGSHTDEVSEAITNHRLIVANHALLMALQSGLETAGPDTLLFIDEAHMLEDAATSAMTPVFEYGLVEQLPSEVVRWMADAARHETLEAVRAANHDLERYLDGETLPRAVMPCFDTASGEVGSRTTALLSPRSGITDLRDAVAVMTILRELHRHLRSLLGAMGAYQAADLRTDHFATERFRAVLAKVLATNQAVAEILIHAHELLGEPMLTDVVDQGAAVDDVASTDEPSGQDETDLEETEPTSDDDPESLIPDDATLDLLDAPPDEPSQGARPAPPTPNRVLWAQEMGRSDLAPGSRQYRFRLASSPIALPAEPAWTQFTAMVPRTFYVSATLTVAGEWTYIRRRLGLAAGSVPGIVLESPFDIANQARLVCLGDFPSWSEHSELAVRSVAWQLSGYAHEVVRRSDEALDLWDNGALVLTTSTAAASKISLRLESIVARWETHPPVHTSTLVGNARALDNFLHSGGILVGTRGLWQGVDIARAERLRLVWINKLPFAPFADPVFAARRALAVEEADLAGEDDPERAATESFYLPLAAIALRQAVGRLIRTNDHRGVVVISDPKLYGPTPQRQAYRRVLLGSLDPGLLLDDPETGERGGGNVVSMREGWRRIWSFLAEVGLLERARLAELTTDESLDAQAFIPETRAILSLALSEVEEAQLRAQGPEAFRAELVERSARIGALLRGDPEPLTLKPRQVDALEAVADGLNVLAVLPTGYGKSFAFQLPALVLPGITVVVSPLVSLMHDQAIDLNRSIGGAVRALVAPLTESNSRLGKAEVADALSGRDAHGIRIVYLSPERLCTRQFQDLVERGVAKGIVRRIAIDEAHTAVQWGDDFRPSFRRMQNFLGRLRTQYPQLAVTALTATANRTVLEGIRQGLFALPARPDGAEPGFRLVMANPIRPELALYRRTLGPREGGVMTVQGLVEAVVATLDEHAIFYCLTVKEVEALYAQLRAVLGSDADHRVRKYHGRLTEAEKTSTLTHFVEASARGDDDFSPMIVVATSAFGLGIDRPDVRCVFVVSPPTDLAALYQQLGRAGRDRSARPVDPAGISNVGLALGTNRGFGLVQWMTHQDPGPALFRSLAEDVLAIGTNPSRPEFAVICAEDLAARHVQADTVAGRLSERESASSRTSDMYRTAVARVVVALCDLGAVEDLGDFPARVKVLRGELRPADPMLAHVVDHVLSLGAVSKSRVDVVALHDVLASDVAGYQDAAADPGATWALLVDMHALGYLDVAQTGAGAPLTGLVLRGDPSWAARAIPVGFNDYLVRRSAQASRELEEMRAWYEATTCANEGLARYFEVPEMPEDTCVHGVARCSTCWSSRAVAESGETLPPVLQAFRQARPRPSATTASGRPIFQRRLDDHVESLLWENRRGLTPGLICRVLRGDDDFYDRRQHKRVRLWSPLYETRHRGSVPGVSLAQVDESLGRLAARCDATFVGRYWRLTRYVHEDERRAAFAVAASVEEAS
jgi:RecQ family ATP-dependent DNA helicase